MTDSVKDEGQMCLPVEDSSLRTVSRSTTAIRPFSLQLTAKAHRPIYRMHRYFARRPYNLFAELVDHFTQPGDLVLDPFMGGGVTLVEATERGRYAIGFDTSPLASFVSRTELLPLDISGFEKAITRIRDKLGNEMALLYRTSCRTCKADATVDWYEHSLVSDCELCELKFPISAAEKIGIGTWSCPGCKTPVKATSSSTSPTVLVALLVRCEACGPSIEKPTQDDLDQQEKLDASRADVLASYGDVIPDADVPDNNMQRESALHKKGILKFHQFFTVRQLVALSTIRRAIEDEPAGLRAHLLLAFSSTLRFANRMVTRNPAWRGDRPLEWVGTGFWLPAVYLDANLGTEFTRRASAVIKGKRDFNGPTLGGEGTVSEVNERQEAAWSIETRSSTSLPLPDCSVDAIITDPPYGSYVHYADMSNFWNVWLPRTVATGAGSLIDTTEEAVVARKNFPGAKDARAYGELLKAVFEECFRVLKPGRTMVLTFNNREPRAWSALLVAALQAGFHVPTEGVHFQPGIKNYRHTARTRRAGSVHGDFVISFQKLSVPADLPTSTGLPDPLGAEEVATRLNAILGGRSLTPEQLMREFYTSLIPDLLRYLEVHASTPAEAEVHLQAVDELDIFDSERRERLASIIEFRDGLWTARKAG